MTRWIRESLVPPGYTALYTAILDSCTCDLFLRESGEWSLNIHADGDSYPQYFTTQSTQQALVSFEGQEIVMDLTILATLPIGGVLDCPQPYYDTSAAVSPAAATPPPFPAVHAASAVPPPPLTGPVEGHTLGGCTPDFSIHHTHSGA